MKLLKLVLLLFLIPNAAPAQPARNPQTGASQAVSEQRRVELREVLKARPASEPAQRQGTGAPPNRHLSDQERADLRRELRQQGSQPASQRP
ncbi:MAG: hypothetical protein ACOYNZ_10480 [Rhodoferax sp.]